MKLLTRLKKLKEVIIPKKISPFREQFELSFKRPSNFFELTLQEQMNIDETLGIDGSWWPKLHPIDLERFHNHYGLNQGPKVANYVDPVPAFMEIKEDLFEIDTFIEHCEAGLFTDYDGYGNPYRFGLIDHNIRIKPSRLKEIPTNATHILWYNK